MDDKHQAAIDYAEMGYKVFPCVPGGKTPATKHGCLDATNDVEQIDKWWSANPNYNVAISTDGSLVLDVDPAGKSWLSSIDNNDLAAGAITLTPRDGKHFWFKQNGEELRNTSGTIAPGVDTRANGGYVLVPPSIVDGKHYRWVNDLEPDQPVAPRWLLELLGQVTRQPVRESVGQQIPEGSRNHMLFKLGCNWRNSGLDEEEIFGCLQVANQKRCKPPLSDRELRKIAESAGRYEPDFLQESLVLNHMHDDDEDEPEFTERAVTFPRQLFETMPTVMRKAFNWVLDTAIKPQPELTLGSLISLFGAVLGQQVRDDYDTRTNVMVLALAPSGAGKEHPRQANKKLLAAAGLQAINGPERIGSHAGLVACVASHPVRLFQLDEIGRLLITMRNPQASHLYNVGTVLMALYSSANSFWTGDAYADQSRIKEIDQPHACIFGTSVPESLYTGLTPENLTDGLVGRLVVLEAKELPIRRKPTIIEPPHEVVHWMRSWTNQIAQPMALDSATLGQPDRNLAERRTSPQPRLIKKTPEASERHESYCDAIQERHKDDDPIASAVWARSPEKAAKLALIHACSQGDDTPEITLESENWGIALANYSTRLVLQSARNAVAGSKYESDLKRVFKVIPANGCTSSQLCRQTQWLKRKERDEIMFDLQRTGAVERIESKTNGRPKVKYRRRRDVL